MVDQPVSPALKESKENGPAPQKLKGRKRLIIFGSILLTLIAAVLVFIFFSPGFIPGGGNSGGGKDHSKDAEENSTKVRGHLYSMDPLIVNLMDTEPQRYLKIRIDIESHEIKANEEFEKRLPQLRDLILTILTSKTYKEVYDSEGKKKLKEEMILKANQLLGNLKVKTFYFTEFVVQ